MSIIIIIFLVLFVFIVLLFYVFSDVVCIATYTERRIKLNSERDEYACNAHQDIALGGEKHAHIAETVSEDS